MSVKVIFPMPPNIANKRYRPRIESFVKRDYIQGKGMVVGAKTLAVGQTTGHRKPIPNAIVAATFYLRGSKIMDDDNAKARLKWPLDALVKAGVLVDDSRPHCTVLDPEQKFDRKNPRLEIEITEAG